MSQIEEMPQIEEINCIEEENSREKEEDNDNLTSATPPKDIVAFNELRSCADIYRMYSKKQLDINPDFQRGVVWSNKSQTLFIDSLIKQLPIPSLCISLDAKTTKRLVIDGLQRISSIIKFLDDSEENNDWKLSEIDDVDIRLSGKKVSDIKRENIELFEILENLTIPITVLRCDYEKSAHMEYLFQIFHRLNSGGNKLYNQEIRNCIYHGNLNDLLKEIVRTSEWFSFVNTSLERVEKSRFANEEMILRFFAFYNEYEQYDGRLANFLNTCMKKYQNLDNNTYLEYKELILKTLRVVNKLTSKPTSKYVIDAVLVGVAKNIERMENAEKVTLDALLLNLMEEEEFHFDSLKAASANKEKVKTRISTSIKTFATHG